MEKLKIRYPILVEGKYDKIKLESVLDAQVIQTDGFQIFKRDEQAAMLRRMAEQVGKLIVLTDSDGAGRVIRGHLRGVLPADAVIDLYIPEIRGKERRKVRPSAAGLLGVEGMSSELLRELFLPYAGEELPPVRADLTKTVFYLDGLSGREDSRALRECFCCLAGLPREMSANALLAAVRMLFSEAEYRELLEKARKQAADSIEEAEH